VSDQPSWHKTALETSLTGLLGADSISSDYALSNFSFLPSRSTYWQGRRSLSIPTTLRWRKVPEPGTLALLGSAVLDLGLLRSCSRFGNGDAFDVHIFDPH
jgi:hypothetical protein